MASHLYISTAMIAVESPTPVLAPGESQTGFVSCGGIIHITRRIARIQTTMLGDVKAREAEGVL